MANFEGKLALITGGASGIGRSLCQLLDREGARVAVADINLAGAQETVGMLKNPKEHLAVHMDVSSKDSVTKGIEAIEKVFGAPPSLLGHCAGYLEFIPLGMLEEEDFNRMIDVNLKGTFLVAQSLGKALKEADIKHGSFVLMSSASAYNSYKITAHYAASKAGVISLTQTFAKDLADDGIRVNTVVPGLTVTPIMDSQMMKKSIEEILPKVSIKRPAEPEDVAEVVVFLLSDRSKYVTGAEYRVDGGYHA